MAVGTTIFFAGAEVETLTRALLDNGVRNILYSYFYIMQMRRENFIERMQQSYPDVNWFLDSGAFTYMVRYRSAPEKLPELKEYLKRYFAYIEAYGHNYCRVTEPDMDIAGIEPEQVYEWTEEMLSRWPHLNITPVWHKGRGMERWREYCRDPRIRTLAIGSGTKSNEVGALRGMILEAAKYGKPTHCFGMTRINTVLRHIPPDSVDSTSWVMGQKAGVTYIFRANRFRVLPSDKKNKRRMYASYFKNIGCDPKKVIEDDVAEVRKANIIAWRMLAARLDWMKTMGGQTDALEAANQLVRTSLPVATDPRFRQPADGVRRDPVARGVELEAVERPERSVRLREEAPLLRDPRWRPKHRRG